MPSVLWSPTHAEKLPRDFYAEKVQKKKCVCRRRRRRGGKMGRNTGNGGEREGKKGRRGGRRLSKGVLLPVWLLLDPEFLSENKG